MRPIFLPASKCQHDQVVANKHLAQLLACEICELHPIKRKPPDLSREEYTQTQLGLVEAINRSLSILDQHLPYSESDHVLNIAYNLLAGGTCLDHLELRQNDATNVVALGGRRIADPTTAGDFCRRLESHNVLSFAKTILLLERAAQDFS